MKMYTREYFEKIAKDRNPSIIIISEYMGSTKPIFVRCEDCGNEWKINKASNLINRNCSCEMCNLKQKQRDFYEAAERKNKHIDVIGDYSGYDTPVLVRCRLCKREWSMIPYSILHGNGCSCKRAYSRKSHEFF